MTIPKYITSVILQNIHSKHTDLFLGLEEDGTVKLYHGDNTELGQDEHYLNEMSFPNSGLLVHGKYSMWFSFFSKYICSISEKE